MKPYISLFKENKEGHSSMQRRGINSYISAYEQNSSNTRSNKKNMEPNRGYGNYAKTAIPPKKVSIKVSVEEKSTKNEILKASSHPHVQQIFNFNITTSVDIDKTISTIMRSISQIL